MPGATPSPSSQDFVGCAVSPDGTAWFLSRDLGLASWDAKQQYDYQTIVARAVPALGTPVDIAADPDGTLWLTDGAQLFRWDPTSGAAVPLALPYGDVRRLSLDARSQPRALFVSTGDGLAIYRGP
jgi:streptogramin lyase